MDLQALVDGMSAQWMRERATSQMTLGALIERLKSLPTDTRIALSDPHSYRGYYSDLSFEPFDSQPASDLLVDCIGAMGAIFTGYKGGEFPMHSGVPVWVANRGSCGKKLMAVNDDGSLELAPDED